MVVAGLRFERFSGPLPEPRTLARYNQAFEGGAKWVVEHADRQSTHRQYMERQLVAADIKFTGRGLNYGFLIALVALIGGFGLIALGKSAEGLVPVILAVTTLVGAFIYREVSSRRGGSKGELPAPPPTDEDNGEQS
jgi:uncharacterized membrane protein